VNTDIRNIIVILAVVVLSIIGGFFLRQPSTTVFEVVKPDTSAIRIAEMQLIRVDLNEYPDLSTEIKDQMAKAIQEASKRYTIPPQLIHAIIQIESDYRFNIDHAEVTIKVKGKSVKTRCRGLGGILFDSWADSLKKEGIAEKSSDLYIPRNNILAIGFILRTIINDELARDRDGWIVRRIISQYFGKISVDYEQKMKEKTSVLWLKRIAREIETTPIKKSI
jgi:hypothetical protein